LGTALAAPDHTARAADSASMVSFPAQVAHTPIGAVDLNDPMPRAAQKRCQTDAVGAAPFDTELDLAVLATQLGCPSSKPSAASSVDRDGELTGHRAEVVHRDRDVHMLVGIHTNDDAPARRIRNARQLTACPSRLRGHGAAGRTDRTVMGPAAIRLL